MVAIDFGTTYSGYAYSFTHDPDNVHIMRKWEGKLDEFWGRDKTSFGFFRGRVKTLKASKGIRNAQHNKKNQNPFFGTL